VGANHLAVAQDACALGAILEALGQHAAAQRLYHGGLRIFRSGPKAHAYDIAVTLNNLATSYYTQGKLARAEQCYAQALVIKEKILGPNHVDVALTLNNVALLHKSRGEWDRAETCCRRALSILRRTLSPRHPKVMACRSNYRSVLARQPTGGPPAHERKSVRS
jgi:tetratricopeptide (TPR) repeat protein